MASRVRIEKNLSIGENYLLSYVRMKYIYVCNLHYYQPIYLHTYERGNLFSRSIRGSDMYHTYNSTENSGTPVHSTCQLQIGR